MLLRSGEGERIGQGRENARKLLLENPVLAKPEEGAASEAPSEA